MDIIHEALEQPMKYPEGFKPNIKTDSARLKSMMEPLNSMSSRNGSALAYRYAILQLRGPSTVSEMDRIHVVHLIDYIEGDALKWFT